MVGVERWRQASEAASAAVAQGAVHGAAAHSGGAQLSRAPTKHQASGSLGRKVDRADSVAPRIWKTYRRMDPLREHHPHKPAARAATSFSSSPMCIAPRESLAADEGRVPAPPSASQRCIRSPFPRCSRPRRASSSSPHRASLAMQGDDPSSPLTREPDEIRDTCGWARQLDLRHEEDSKAFEGGTQRMLICQRAAVARGLPRDASDRRVQGRATSLHEGGCGEGVQVAG